MEFVTKVLLLAVQYVVCVMLGRPGLYVGRCATMPCYGVPDSESSAVVIVVYVKRVPRGG